MTLHHRPAQEPDFGALLNFLRAAAQAAPGAGHLHPGDLTWWLRQNTSVQLRQSVEVFLDLDGHIRGFVFRDPVTWAAVQAAPDLSAADLEALLV
ncbi:hypothetical protein [Deinococcus hohokamensis]|uniref:GNAT family N-acetyltransferase n=1 Tax=Deinococcus hohokamensis TaxID=309883 RepID=A0ABV9I9U8_9DEIO